VIENDKSGGMSAESTVAYFKVQPFISMVNLTEPTENLKIPTRSAVWIWTVCLQMRGIHVTAMQPS